VYRHLRPKIPTVLGLGWILELGYWPALTNPNPIFGCEFLLVFSFFAILFYGEKRFLFHEEVKHASMSSNKKLWKQSQAAKI
jgi:hypothetical protein